MLSILILTKNEEQDLPGCLQSVAWCDDVHVFDSFSEDQTIAVAEHYHAKISQRRFDNYAAQRNAALTLPFLHEWILILDADERITKELYQEFCHVLPQVPQEVNGFRIRRRDFLYDTWLKHAQLSPFYIRLIRKGKAQYHRAVNEVVEVNGMVGQLEGYFDHFPFSKGHSHWLAKHNIYSTMEAQRWVEEHQGNFQFSVRRALFSKDFHERRYHQKGLFYKLPGRPLIKWLYMMFVRRAFLDGKAGITYAFLQSIYEYFIVLKTNELLRNIKK
ncbi:MAG: glycosyltransferase family 2 protein [Spirosomataceae bacterium]